MKDNNELKMHMNFFNYLKLFFNSETPAPSVEIIKLFHAMIIHEHICYFIHLSIFINIFIGLSYVKGQTFTATKSL